MFCPVCRLEYRDAYIRCSECGAALVAEIAPLAQPERRSFEGEPPAVLWRGQDPVAFSAILSALTDSGIPFHDSNRRDYTASLSRPLALGFYGLPYWQIFVHPRDFEQARQVMEAALKPQPSIEHDSSLEPQACPKAMAPAPEGEPAGKTRLTPVAVWHGESSERAESLRDLLIQNGIPCWESAGIAGSLHLYVPAEFQARARAVIEPELERAQSA